MIISTPLEQRPGRVRDGAAIGQIRKIADAIPVNPARAVQQRHRHESGRADRELPRQRKQHHPRNAAALRRPVLEGVRKDPPQIRQRALVAVTGNRLTLQRIEPPHIVEPQHVVRVAVRVEDRVHAAQPVLQRLRAEIGRRVDEHRRAARDGDENGGARAVSRGSSDRQVAHSQPIIGTPCDVPEPSTSTLAVDAAFAGLKA